MWLGHILYCFHNSITILKLYILCTHLDINKGNHISLEVLAEVQQQSFMTG